jgi:hypothetical protein
MAVGARREWVEKGVATRMIECARIKATRVSAGAGTDAAVVGNAIVVARARVEFRAAVLLRARVTRWCDARVGNELASTRAVCRDIRGPRRVR